MYSDLASRVGAFFILVGTILVGLFLVSDVGGTPHYELLLISLVTLVIGFALRRRRQPQTPSERFRAYREMRERRKRKKEERLQRERERKQ